MEVTVRALLRAAHMKRQDMVFQYLSDQEALSAVASGRVDAALVMGAYRIRKSMKLSRAEPFA